MSAGPPDYTPPDGWDCSTLRGGHWWHWDKSELTWVDGGPGEPIPAGPQLDGGIPEGFLVAEMTDRLMAEGAFDDPKFLAEYDAAESRLLAEYAEKEPSDAP